MMAIELQPILGWVKSSQHTHFGFDAGGGGGETSLQLIEGRPNKEVHSCSKAFWNLALLREIGETHFRTQSRT